MNFVNGRVDNVFLVSNLTGSTTHRSLYSASVLGLDKYKKRRIRTQKEFEGTADELRYKMSIYVHADSAGALLRAEDLTNILHLIEKKPKDLSLVEKVLKK